MAESARGAGLAGEALARGRPLSRGSDAMVCIVLRATGRSIVSSWAR
jgi:hypothetical protein